MKSKLAVAILFFVAVSLVAAAQVVTARPAPNGPMMRKQNYFFYRRGDSPKWWKDSEVIKQISLSDAQAQQIEQAFYDHRLKLIDLLGRVDKEELKLHHLIDADEPDEAQVNAQVDQVVAARGALEKENAAMMLNIRRVLSLEQWKKLQTLRGDELTGGPMFMRTFEMQMPDMEMHGGAPMPMPPPMPPADEDKP